MGADPSPPKHKANDGGSGRPNTGSGRPNKSKTVRRPLARKLLLGVLVLAGALGGIVFAEIALRVVGLGDPIVYRTNTAYRYAPRPSQSVQRRRGASVTINESGYRSTESWTKPAALRVLWIGDSVTWGGTYIDDRDTFAELSCEVIEEAAGLEAVCGNAGVNAYGVDNMTSRLRYDRSGDSADVVVAVVGWPNLFRAQQYIGGNSWLQRSPPGWFPALWELAAYEASRMLVFLQGEGSCDEAYGPAVARASLAGLLRELARKQNEGAIVLFVRHPAVHEAVDVDAESVAAIPYLPWCAESASALLREFGEAVASSGVPYMDMASVARREAMDSEEPFFYDDWAHLEVRGHQVYAQEIGNKILELTGALNN